MYFVSFAAIIMMVRNIDMFGRPVRFSYKNHEKSKSGVGAVFSILLFGFCVFLLYLFSKDLFNRTNPTTLVSQSFEQDPSSMTLGPDYFSFGFGLQKPISFEHYKDETIYSVQAFQYTLQKVQQSDGSYDTVFSQIQLELEDCTTTHFGSVGSNFANLELDELYCIKTTQSGLDTLTIQGTFESDTYKWFQANFYACSNSTSSVTCADSDTINSYLEGGYFATYFTSLAIDPSSYSTPNVKFRNSFFTTAAYPYFKEIDQYLVHTYVEDDIGWITSDTTTKTYVNYDLTQEMTSYNTLADTDSIIHFLVRPGQETSTYSRTYKRVQDVFAQVNGVASAALIAAAVILSPYVHIKFNESLINDLFDVKIIQEDENAKDQEENNKKTCKDRLFRRKKGKKNAQQNKQGKNDAPPAIHIDIGSPISSPNGLEMTNRPLFQGLNAPSDFVTPNQSFTLEPNQLAVTNNASNVNIPLNGHNNFDSAENNCPEKQADNAGIKVPTITHTIGNENEMDFVTSNRDIDTADPRTDIAHRKISAKANPRLAIPTLTKQDSIEAGMQASPTKITTDSAVDRKKLAKQITKMLYNYEESGGQQENEDILRTVIIDQHGNEVIPEQEPGPVVFEKQPSVQLRIPELKKQGSSYSKGIVNNYLEVGGQQDSQGIAKTLTTEQYANELSEGKTSVKLEKQGSVMINPRQLHKQGSKHIPAMLSNYEEKTRKHENHEILRNLIVDQNQKPISEDVENENKVGLPLGDDGIIGIVEDNMAKSLQKEKTSRFIGTMNASVAKKHIEAGGDIPTREHVRRLTSKMRNGEHQLNITFWEYLQFFFYKTKKVKQKMRLLQMGVARINERLDIFNVFRKFREVDKLKLVLLESEQVVLFDHLPKPELLVDYNEPESKFGFKKKKKTMKSMTPVTPTGSEKKRYSEYFQESNFVKKHRDLQLTVASFDRLKEKENKTIIDEKFIAIYEDLIKSDVQL